VHVVGIIHRAHPCDRFGRGNLSVHQAQLFSDRQLDEFQHVAVVAEGATASVDSTEPALSAEAVGRSIESEMLFDNLALELAEALNDLVCR